MLFPFLDLYMEIIFDLRSAFNLANDTILWTLGVFLVNKHNKAGWKDNIKHLINGNTIAFAAGLVILLKVNFMPFIKQIPYIFEVSGFVKSALYPLGEVTVPLSMLFIGLILSEIKISNAGDLLKSLTFVLSFSSLY